jgi:hypothetical protein
MTDARYPDRWLNDKRVTRLTDRAYRAFVCALAWSVSNETDGIIEPADLPMIPGFAACCEDELVASGLWAESECRWVITVFEDTQTSAAEHQALRTARAKNKARQARWRAGKSASRNVTNDVTNNATLPVEKQVTTQARLGQASPDLDNENETESTQVSTSPSEAESLPKSGTSLAAAAPAKSAKPSKRGTRLPDDWKPPDDVVRAMHAQFPHLDLRLEHAKFSDYWHAKAGAGATKLDWVATWRNWIRSAAERAPTRTGANGSHIATSDLRVMQGEALKQQIRNRTNNGKELT